MEINKEILEQSIEYARSDPWMDGTMRKEPSEMFTMDDFFSNEFHQLDTPIGHERELQANIVARNYSHALDETTGENRHQSHGSFWTRLQEASVVNSVEDFEQELGERNEGSYNSICREVERSGINADVAKFTPENGSTGCDMVLFYDRQAIQIFGDQVVEYTGNHNLTEQRVGEREAAYVKGAEITRELDQVCRDAGYKEGAKTAYGAWQELFHKKHFEGVEKATIQEMFEVNVKMYESWNDFLEPLHKAMLDKGYTTQDLRG
jgi:hypothetical protein